MYEFAVGADLSRPPPIYRPLYLDFYRKHEGVFGIYRAHRRFIGLYGLPIACSRTNNSYTPNQKIGEAFMSTYIHTLLATLGGQPQVITFTLDLLLQRGYPISEVVLVHPEATHPRLQQSLEPV